MSSTQSNISETSRSGVPDFYLPDEILSVIPTDPYEQLDLARKITSMAIASRVTKLESELGRLRQKLNDKDRVIVDLEDKVSDLQRVYEEADLRLKITRDENVGFIHTFYLVFHKRKKKTGKCLERLNFEFTVFCG